MIVVIVAFGWWLLRSSECHLIKGDFLQHFVSVTRTYIEHYYKRDVSRLNADFNDPYMSDFESRSLIATVNHDGDNARRGTWRITFSPRSHCFSDKDFLDLTYEIPPKGGAHVECTAQFANPEIIPRGCHESDSN